MSNLRVLIPRLEAGETVQARPHGNSMTPIIYSGDLVTIAPAPKATPPVIGSTVLCVVNGRVMLHRVTAIGADGRVQISNNHGHVNGWTRRIYGVVVAVERSQPGTRVKQ